MTSLTASGERTEAFQRNMITASVMMATTVVIIDMTIATIALGGADPGRAVATPRRCPGVQQAPLHNLQLID